MIYRKYLKRILDILFSLSVLLIIWPLIAMAIIAIKLSSIGPIFFTQARVGLNGKPFKIYKLRTMYWNPEREIKQTTQADPEVFFVGKILRRLKLDELPQVFNVLLGDMSIVGPRPCLEQTKQDMPAWAIRRFDVRPGMTGLAQVNGNIELPWQSRWKYDIYYIENYTFLFDAWIILKTVLVVFLGEGRFRRSE